MAAVLKSTWQGKDRVLDFESITSREYKVIKRHTGLKMGQFEQAFLAPDGLDCEVIDCLLWLFLKRDGRDVDPATLDDYSPFVFMAGVEVVPDESAEPDDPKVDSPSTPSEADNT